MCKRDFTPDFYEQRSLRTFVSKTSGALMLANMSFFFSVRMSKCKIRSISTRVAMEYTQKQ